MPAYFARVTYPAVGGTQEDFAVPFPYLLSEHVKVRVAPSGTEMEDAEDALEEVDYTWTSDSLVHFAVAPGAGADVRIKRETSQSELPARLTGSAPIISGEINAVALHLLYVSQEVADQSAYDVSVLTAALEGGIEDATLRADLLAQDGSQRVHTKSAETGSVARSIYEVLGSIRVSIEDFGAVADWNGATGTDNYAAIEAACATGAREVLIPPKPFRIGSTLKPRSGQQLVGAPSGLLTASATTNRQPLLAFRPSGADKVAIKNAVGTNGQGFRGFSLDLNNATHYGFQLTTTYGIVSEDITFFGVFDIGVLLQDAYVCTFNRTVMNGIQVKRAGFLIGASNAVVIRDFHSSMLPYDPLVCMRGIGLAGGGAAYLIEGATLQGPTIGLDIGAVSSVDATGIYTENTVCPVRIGQVSGAVNAIGVTLKGQFGLPYNTHPQYAARGPIIYYASGRAVELLSGRFDNTPDSSNGAGKAWPILCGAGATSLRVSPQSIFGSTADKDLIMRTGAGDSPSVDMTNEYGANGARELMLKKDGAFGGTHFGIRIDAAGALSTVAWAPSVIAGAVDPLLSGLMPTPSAILL